MSGFGDNSYSYVEHQRMLRETFGMSVEAKAAYLDGFMAGMMGFPTDHLSEAALVGYAAGSAGKAKSEELRKRKVEAGKRSAEARNEKNGSSDPRANREQNVNTVTNTVHEPVPENREQNVNVGRKEGRKKERKEANASSLTKTAPLTSAPAREPAAVPGAVFQDFSQKPTREAFLAHAARRWPEWHQDKVAAIWEELTGRNRDWTMPDGAPIWHWGKLLTKLRSLTDPAHVGERYNIGAMLREAAPSLAASMRFRP